MKKSESEPQPLKLSDSDTATDRKDEDIKDLNRKSVRGGAVTLSSQAASIAIQLASSVVLARLLSPEDYGIIAMVLAVTAFAGLFRDLGLSSAAIQKKNLTRAQQSNLFWINVAMGSLLTSIVAAGAPLVAHFYAKPELLKVTMALSATFVIVSLGTQHGAMLVKRMQFGRKAIATISGSLVTLVVAVTLAFHGYSYWSLVWGNIAGAVITTVWLLVLSPFHPMWLSKGSGVREMLGFGASVTVFDFANYFSRNLDNVLIGRHLGTVELGFYSRAYSLLMFPISAVRGPINAVGYPALSKLQDHPEEYRQFSRNITALIAFLSMPMVAFMGTTSHLLIPLAFGEGWTASIPIFSILAVAAFFQPVSAVRGQVMLSMGYSGRYARWGIANALLISMAFLIGINWGAYGVAIAYSITNTIILLPSVVYAFRGTPLKIGDFIGPITRPMVSSLIAGSILILKNNTVEMEVLPVWVYAILDMTLFTLTYVGLIALVESGRNELKSMIVACKKIIMGQQQTSLIR